MKQIILPLPVYNHQIRYANTLCLIHDLKIEYKKLRLLGDDSGASSIMKMINNLSQLKLF